MMMLMMMMTIIMMKIIMMTIRHRIYAKHVAEPQS